LVKFDSDQDRQMSSWQALDVLMLSEHPLYTWLACQHSLTEELSSYLNSDINVHVLKEYQTRLNQQDLNLLELMTGPETEKVAHDKGVVRDIILESGEVGYIGARTIMSEATWDHCQLAALGNTPIGTLLFDNPINSQRHIEVQSYSQLQASEWKDFSRIQHDKNQPIWVRRSVFMLQQQPIIIHELFSDRLV
jgi:chorismate lyase